MPSPGLRPRVSPSRRTGAVTAWARPPPQGDGATKFRGRGQQPRRSCDRDVCRSGRGGRAAARANPA
eukprot:7715929-Lingulodinium_polyedra.AAC.1